MTRRRLSAGTHRVLKAGRGSPLQAQHQPPAAGMWSTLLLSALFACASAAALGGSTDGADFAHHQLEVLRLFAKIQQPVLIPEHDEVLKAFKWESMKDKFKDPTMLERFMYLYDHHVFLERNKDFSMTYMAHFWQMKQLYKLLHSATDFETFWKMAVWMRYHMNERMFAHALYTVLLHREDTHHMMLPPPYEVFPEYFVTSDVMQMAYDAHLRGLDTKEDAPYIIEANYTGWMEARDTESVLSYFREDVGLAAYWAFFGYKFPFWVNTAESSQPMLQHRGRLFYILIRNLLARYDMERYSRGMPPVWPVELWEPVEGYDPEIRHQSGHEFPARPEGLKPRSTDVLSMEDLMDWERRIRDGVAMSIYLDDKVQIQQLNEENAMKMISLMLKGGEDSPNIKYYGSVYYGLFTIFGHLMDPYHKYGMTPTALEIPETMTRDPLFYRVLKRMWKVMDGYKNTLPPYHKEDLMVPGVKIESMKMDKLMTYFDDFDIHVDNAIDVQKIEDAGKVNVIARQHRLNHKPFTCLLKISSEKEMNAVVRLFLGPGDGSGKIWTGDDMRHHFYLLDAFEVKLNSGENSIVRGSRQMFLVAEEAMAFRQMLNKVEASLKGGEKLSPGADKEKYDGFPHRLMLPQGRRTGLPVTLVAIVTDSKGNGWEGQRITDHRDPFFPMDRRLFMWELETVPNAHVEHVNIFHRSMNELNVSEE
ncbi:allergen Cr-PI-like [Schistocerca piceifrons]|uniref:allergen Cr-PI-like n=1 Tax=Schistocerca piceifrons TaxID=274613 RepID=UPI001F5E61D2|nr:allergen Cr-PI-like [Schistocerca piceifrons]